jgi:CRP-like cAMP-binding protein
MRSWLKRLLIDPEFNRKREFLQKVSLFQDISRREFGALFQCLVVRQYHAGEVLCREGDIGRALFILEEGEVEIYRKGPSRAPQLSDHEGTLSLENKVWGDESRKIASLKSGDYFGEISLIDEQPRTATVTAVGKVRAYLLYKTEIDKLLREAPRIAAAIMTHLAALLAVRLRASMNRAPFALDSTDQVKIPTRLQ